MRERSVVHQQPERKYRSLASQRLQLLRVGEVGLDDANLDSTLAGQAAREPFQPIPPSRNNDEVPTLLGEPLREGLTDTRRGSGHQCQPTHPPPPFATVPGQAAQDDPRWKSYVSTAGGRRARLHGSESAHRSEERRVGKECRSRWSA